MSNRVKKKEDCVRVSYSFKKTEDFVHQIKSEEGKKDCLCKIGLI